MRKPVLLAVLLTTMVVGIPTAVVLYHQHDALVSYRRDSELRTAYCVSELGRATHVLWVLEHDTERYRMKMAAQWSHHYDWPAMYALCMPGTTLPVREQADCWTTTENIDCIVPIARRIHEELKRRWVGRM